MFTVIACGNVNLQNELAALPCDFENFIKVFSIVLSTVDRAPGIRDCATTIPPFSWSSCSKMSIYRYSWGRPQTTPGTYKKLWVFTEYWSMRINQVWSITLNQNITVLYPDDYCAPCLHMSCPSATCVHHWRIMQCDIKVHTCIRLDEVEQCFRIGWLISFLDQLNKQQSLYGLCYHLQTDQRFSIYLSP